MPTIGIDRLVAFGHQTNTFGNDGFDVTRCVAGIPNECIWIINGREEGIGSRPDGGLSCGVFFQHNTIWPVVAAFYGRFVVVAAAKI